MLSDEPIQIKIENCFIQNSRSSGAIIQQQAGSCSLNCSFLKCVQTIAKTKSLISIHLEFGAMNC